MIGNIAYFHKSNVMEEFLKASVRITATIKNILVTIVKMIAI